jgi:DNA-binding NarL/FixJ family response regulator
MNTDLEVAAEAFRCGASAYLLKSCATTELLAAVREALRGKTFISPALSRRKIDYIRRHEKEMVSEAERLTERQREVLQLVAEGKVMKEIADVLCITTRTVAYHKYKIMGLLGVTTNAELIKCAVRMHLVAA